MTDQQSLTTVFQGCQGLAALPWQPCPGSLDPSDPVCSEGKIDGRPLPDGPFGPRPPAVPGDHPADRRQPDPVAVELVRPVQPLERLEQLVGVCRVVPGPVVAD